MHRPSQLSQSQPRPRRVIVPVLALAALCVGCAGQVTVDEPDRSAEAGGAVLDGCAPTSVVPFSLPPPAACTSLAVGHWLMCDGPNFAYESDGIVLNADGMLQGLHADANGELTVVPDQTGLLSWSCDPANDWFWMYDWADEPVFGTDAPRFTSDGKSMWLGIDPYYPRFGRVK